MPTLVPRPTRALLLPMLLAPLAGCITVNTKGYPPVARTDIAPLVASAQDTTYALARPPFTVVGRDGEALDVPSGLTGVARSWQRMFATEPPPVTVVLVEPPAKPKRGQPLVPPALPDSLARRIVVWVPVAPRLDGDRMRRMGGPPGAGGPGMAGGPPAAGTPVMQGGPSASASMQVAQAWLEQRVGGAAAMQALPAWLRAGLVETMAGAGRLPMGRSRDRELPTIPIDSLLARRCPAEWAPVSRWRPMPLGDTATARPDSARRDSARRDRPRPKNAEEAFREDVRSGGCGFAFRLTSASFVRFLLDRAGEPTADALVKGAQAGSTLEQSLAGVPGASQLPRTTAELERAWRAWEKSGE